MSNEKQVWSHQNMSSILIWVVQTCRSLVQEQSSFQMLSEARKQCVTTRQHNVREVLFLEIIILGGLHDGVVKFLIVWSLYLHQQHPPTLHSVALHTFVLFKSVLNL